MNPARIISHFMHPKCIPPFLQGIQDGVQLALFRFIVTTTVSRRHSQEVGSPATPILGDKQHGHRNSCLDHIHTELL